MATTNKKGRDSGKSATPTTSANDTAPVSYTHLTLPTKA